MPDQVEPAADTQRFPHTANIFPLRERDTGREYSF